MKLSKKNICLISAIFLVVLCIAYSLFLFALPPILNSHKFVSKYESILSQKLSVKVHIQDFKLKTNPDLSIDITAKSIDTNTPSKEDSLNFKNICYKSKVLSLKPQKLDIDYIQADFNRLKSYFESDKKSKKSQLNINYLPLINIKKASIKLDKNNSQILLYNVSSQKKDGKVVCNFLAKLQVPYVQSSIILGERGSIYYSNKLYFDKLSVKFNNSKVYISGPLDNLTFKGKNLPANELETSFLYFYKFKHPHKKNFIENFTNFSGNLDVDLKWTKDGLTGICIAKNLGALFSKYKIDVLFPSVEFNFTGRNVSANTSGYFGPDPVSTDFYLTGLATDSVHTKGTVSSKLSNKFSQKYFPAVKIIGRANAIVKYEVQSNTVNIDYYLNVNKGNNLVSKYGNLNCTDKNRQIYAHTVKIGNKIYLKNYDYSFLNGKSKQLVMSGDALFEKIKGHYKPSYLTLKTNGQVPVYVVKSFIKDFLNDGTFRADLRYEFFSKTLKGSLNLYNTYHSDFLFLDNTNILVNADRINLDSRGTFFDSPITLTMNADNNFKNNILVHDIDIHLNKFWVKRGNMDSFPKDFSNKSNNSLSKDYNIIVKKGRIRVDEIFHKKFQLHDVEIFGALKNNIFDFNIPKTEYAKGILSAKGKYNIAEHSSDIIFIASDIDSNEVASNIFNLYNQIEGSAFATLHLETKDKLNDIKAHSTFAVTEGFLPKLGSTEFIIDKSKHKKHKKRKIWKFTLSKVSNIDFSKPNVFYSNLRGSFVVDNNDIKDVKIFSQSDYLSLFIEGDYHIDSELAHLCIWGRHNKTAEKKIRIFKIPLSFLYKLIFRVEHSKDLYQNKLDLIPPIKIKPKDIESVFRVYVSGNLNTENLKVILKDLK